jgi:hypothetical protein
LKIIIAGDNPIGTNMKTFLKKNIWMVAFVLGLVALACLTGCKGSSGVE